MIKQQTANPCLKSQWLDEISISSPALGPKPIKNHGNGIQPREIFKRTSNPKKGGQPKRTIFSSSPSTLFRGGHVFVRFFRWGE